MPRVVHFEIHAGEPARAIEFYSQVFGWQFIKLPGSIDYWQVLTGDPGETGIDGGMIRRRGEIDGQAVTAYVCTVEVDAIEHYEERVVANGGRVVVPRMTLPGFGWQFFAKDTEGNIFGVRQMDPTAS